MAKAEIVLRLFIAVLGDVLKERNALDTIINELNEKLKSANGIRLELIQCATNFLTGFGEESQSMFNGQTPENYDLFIAIFGNPTRTSNKEALDIIKKEFYRTFEFHKAKPKSVKIMLLFKKAPIRENDIDIHLLKEIQEFEWEVERSNFYSPFKTTKEFENLISTNLGQTILKWADTPLRIMLEGEIQPSLESKPQPEDAFVAEDILKTRIADGIDKTEVVTFTLKDIARGFADLHNQLSQMKDTQTASRSMIYYLTNFEKMMAAILPVFKESFNDAIEPYIKLIDKKLKFANEDPDATRFAVLNSIRSSRSEIMESIKTISRFQEFIEDFEWNDPDFENARQNALSLISQLLDHIKTWIPQLTKAVKNILKLLQDSNLTTDFIQNTGIEDQESKQQDRHQTLTDKEPYSIIPGSNSPISVFISYASEDKEHFIRLRKHLKPPERTGIIKVLADNNIQPGEKWQDLIESYVDSADVAILMVSVNYLESDFIYEKELMPLIEDSENRGLRLIPIIIDYCSFTGDEKLKKLQFINDPNTPLCELDVNKHDKVYSKVVKSIIQLIQKLRSQKAETKKTG